MLSAIRLTISLLKLRAGVAIGATALAGIAAANGPAPSLARIAGMGLAVLGASCATGAFNHYYERDVDRLMRRTQGRPFASGAFRPGWWWPAGFIVLLVASLALAAAAGGGIAAGYVFLGAFAYAVVYTVWLKRRWAWSIAGGGLAGSFVVLAGAAAVDPTPQVLPAVLAVAVYLWAPAHFWTLAAARSDDYRSAGIPMLPLVTPAPTWTLVVLIHAAALLAVLLVPLAFGYGIAYGAGAAAGGSYLLWRSWVLHQAPTKRNAIAAFLASLTQLGLLFLGVVLYRAVEGWT
jgi:protoheme IX farnesyltransferase